jgi:hypothetical protein
MRKSGGFPLAAAQSTPPTRLEKMRVIFQCNYQKELVKIAD